MIGRTLIVIIIKSCWWTLTRKKTAGHGHVIRAREGHVLAEAQARGDLVFAARVRGDEVRVASVERPEARAVADLGLLLDVGELEVGIDLAHGRAARELRVHEAA